MSSWMEMVLDAFEKAGRPSYRDIGKAAGINHETVRQALNGSRAMSEKTAVGIARHLLEPVDAEIAIDAWKSQRYSEDDDERLPPRRKTVTKVHPASVQLRQLFKAYRRDVLKLQQQELSVRLGRTRSSASELENWDQNHSLAVYSDWARALGIEFGLYLVIDGNFQTINCTDVEDSAGQ